jgi:UDP-sugar transporter A1/2/3
MSARSRTAGSDIQPIAGRKDVEAAAPPAASKPPMLFGIELRYLVCGMLVIQNTGAVLLMRYTRSMPGEGQYITQTAVIMQELIKGIACILLLLKDAGTLSSAWAKPGEALKTSVPALLYLVQNNLQYVAVGYLDAATYTVSYQSKIIWSGMLSVLLLGRRLGPHKWLGILLLAAGVAAVQIAGSQQAASQGDEDSAGKAVGLVAIILAAMVSALAGVYFEKILKGAKVGLWTRNLQLAFYSVLVGYGKLASSPQGEALRAGRTSFFFGYTKMTWCCIALNAFGGLLVGTVIKHADAVMKDVALGSSIVCSSLASVYLFDFELNASFAAGIACVIYSVFLYGQRAHCCGALSPPEG